MQEHPVFQLCPTYESTQPSRPDVAPRSWPLETRLVVPHLWSTANCRSWHDCRDLSLEPQGECSVLSSVVAAPSTFHSGGKHPPLHSLDPNQDHTSRGDSGILVTTWSILGPSAEGMLPAPEPCCRAGAGWLTHEHGDDLVAGVLLDLTQPLGQAPEGLLAGDVIGQDQRVGAAVVALRDGSEPLLPCRVPDLQLLP